MKLNPLQRVQHAAMRGLGRVPLGVMRTAQQLMPVNGDGEHLTPEMTAIATAARFIPNLRLVDPDRIPEARTRMVANAATLAERFEPFSIVEDLVIEGPGGPMPATRYRAGTQSRGLLIFFHGGGWVQGSPASHDSPARAFAVGAGIDVLSVDYRLAPEHKFPAALDDAVAAWRFAVERAESWGLDKSKIVVGGDSAGGNLAAVLCLEVRGEPVVPAMQLLIYPVTDLSEERPSRLEFADGYYLTNEAIRWFREQYLPDDKLVTDPRVSPILAADLAGLPRAYVAVAGFDPLRDEGIEYARRLENAGVTVTLDRSSGLLHGFINMALVSADARTAVDRMSAAMVNALS